MIKLNLPKLTTSCFSDLPHNSEVLYQEEKKIASEYENQRLLDFCRGRYCAHECLRQFDIYSPVYKESSGAPNWPKGTIGSISHSKNMAGAIVGKNHNLKAIGLDIETIGRVTPDMWHLFFTDHEIKTINSGLLNDKNVLSTTFFSIKEAFFKMQFSITGQFMDFHDCEILMHNGNFVVNPTVSMKKMPTNRDEYPAHYHLYNDEVISYLIL